MTAELKITRGLPGSGKTTFAHNYFKTQFDAGNMNVMVVSRDDLRAMAGLSSLPTAYEPVITLEHHTLVRTGLKKGLTVVVADCNLRARYVKDLAEIADHFGASVEVIDFDTPLEECIRRDLARGEKGKQVVGEDVIRNMHKRFFVKGKFPANPLTSREEPARLVPYQPDTSKPKAFIFDIDGTVARLNGRSPYDYSKVNTDLAHLDVFWMAWDLYQRGYKIIFLSARENWCYDATVAWLNQNGSIRIPEEAPLFMRQTDDRRADFVIKHEIFHGDIAPHYNIVGVFDDRNQVIDMWRAIGVRAYQVAPGDF